MQAFLRGIREGAIVALLIGICSCPTFALDIAVLSAPQEEAPGTFTTHVFAVTNDASETQTYLLAFVAPPGWDVLGAPGSITVGAEAEETLFVTVTIPADALAGEYDVTLTAVQQDDPDVTASAVASVVVQQTREIELVAPTGASAVPGTSVSYEFVVANRGNSQDSLQLEASSSKRLPVTLSQAAVHLAPQEQVVIRVLLDVPIGTAPGRDVLTVTAVSALYEAVGADAVVYTTVLPPGPENVGSALMEVLPARIRLSMDRDVLSEDFSSRLTFSTSGQIVGGFFTSNVSVDSPLGPDPLEVGSFSILYRRTPTTYAVGNVSQRLTDLVRLSCLGGSVIVDEELYDVSFIAGGSDEETRFAGAASAGPERANLGLAYLGIRDPSPTIQSVWSATAHAEPLEDWTLWIEGALGMADSLSSRAFLFGTEIDTSGLFFNATVYSVGTHFPGSLEDTAGIEVSHRYRLPAMSISASLEHLWDNVIGDPLVETLIQDELGFNLTAKPLEGGPTLGTTIGLEWDRYADLALKSEVDTLVAVSLADTRGVFPYSLSGKVTDQIDHVLDTHVRRTTFSEGAGLSVDSFYLFLQLTQEKHVDQISGDVLSASSDVSIRFRPEGALHEASIVFRNTLDEFDLSASLYIRFVENLDIVFDGSVSWDRVDSDAVTFDWGISLNANVDFPTPFFVTKGQIEGRAYVDLDGDGAYGPEDRALEGIIVVAGGGEASTGPEGVFRFAPIYPGTYALTLRQLPSDAAAGEPIEVELDAGETVWIEIPALPVAAITGRVFEDADQDGEEDPDEAGFDRVRALLTDERGGVRDATTDPAGAFRFRDVLPGRYTIALDAETLPDRFAFTTDETVTVDVTAVEPPPVVLGGFVRPREVIVTFQPPTADFVYVPQAPTAGATITFDGSPSFDFDGEIVSFAWDFDADGTPDADGAVVVHTFSDPGVYEVSLSVVDDSGSSDTIALPVEVVASATGRPGGVATFQPPIADFSFLPAAPNVGDVVRFDGSPSADFDGEIASYEWDFDADGVTDALDMVVEHAFAASGSFAVTLTVTDDGGNADAMTLIVEVSASPTEEPSVEPADGVPVAGFQHTPAQPVAGEPVLLNGTSSLDPGGQVVSFEWDLDGDGRSDSSAPLAEVTFDAPGTYTVSLTVTDDDGNRATISGTIDVAAPQETNDQTSFQPPVADFAYMPGAPAAGDPILFNGTFSSDFDGRIAAYAWDFDSDGTIDSTEAVAEHVFTAPGAYPVTLTVTDNGGNTDTVTISIDVK